MKPLRPIMIMAVGPPLIGVAVSVVEVVVGHDGWTSRSIIIGFVAGMILGALILAPIAFAEAFRTRLTNLLGPHTFAIQWNVSLIMALAMGYILGATRQGASDGFLALALALVFVGAMIKVVIGILFGQVERGGA